MGSWLRRIVTIGLLVALVSPAIRDRDGLPLSTYPMYAATRSNESTFVTASGVDADGARSPLSALTISGSRDRLIAQSFLNDAVRRGDADAVCIAIAERLDEPLVSLEIANERHDTVARLRGEESLIERRVLAGCDR